MKVDLREEEKKGSSGTTESDYYMKSQRFKRSINHLGPQTDSKMSLLSPSLPESAGGSQKEP